MSSARKILPMKILFMSDVPLDNPTSGSEMVLYQQAIGCAGVGREVFAITRHAGSPGQIFRSVGGVKEGTYTASTEKPFRTLFALMRYPFFFYQKFAKSKPFEAVVFHQPFTGFPVLLAGKLRGLAKIYVFHSPSHEEYILSSVKTKPVVNFVNICGRKIIERYCIRKAYRIMVLSRFMAQKACGIHGIPEERIVLNPGGVDLEKFRPSHHRESLKKKLGE